MSEICQRLHQLFNNLKVHSFPFNPREVPLNGIYVLFEEGELAHGTNRVVRIGTHTGKDQLRSRLDQHFIHENKDRSIFRKNIGRALLNRNLDPFLDQWELDLTTHDAKVKYAGKIDLARQKQVERSVTEYIQHNFMRNPVHVGHRFRCMSATESGANRPPIPIHVGHFCG
jgi:hypothetical protein